MKQEHKDFISSNLYLFEHNGRVHREIILEVYRVYNEVFNKNRKPSGCSRCWRAVKDELYKKYKETL